jgi:hypothetical protein
MLMKMVARDTTGVPPELQVFNCQRTVGQRFEHLAARKTWSLTNSCELV